jgi:hypothetical protein
VSPKWSLSFRFHHQSPVCLSSHPYKLHAPPISLCSILLTYLLTYSLHGAESFLRS